MRLSFYDWCINNDRHDILARWDTIKNTVEPTQINSNSRTYAYFNCLDNNNHVSEKFRIDHITSGRTKMSCKQCNSFYQWCIDNDKQELIDAWDVHMNKEDIHYVPHCSGKKYFFNIVNEMPDIQYRLSDITGPKKLSPINKFYNSLGYYLVDNFGSDAIQNYWSDKNEYAPWEYDKCSGKKVWFKCKEKEYHEDYETYVYHFVGGNRCPWCAGKKIHILDSFAQYNIDRLGEDFLNKYWCKDNHIDPWTIRPFTNNVYVHIQCQNKSYHQYNVEASNFSSGTSCPFCNGTKVHVYDSLGVLFPDIINIWSDKNIKSPYEYRPYSHEFVWLKCENGVHEDYRRRISDVTAKRSDHCSKCIKSDRESYFQKQVRLFLEDTPYKLLHEFDCSIVPINPKTNMKLPFDNELRDINGKNLIIETHGIQHYELSGWHIARAKNTNKTPEEEFEYQKWKDEFKKEFAIQNGYEYLEIPYYTITDNTYKNLIIDKINSLQI